MRKLVLIAVAGILLLGVVALLVIHLETPAPPSAGPTNLPGPLAPAVAAPVEPLPAPVPAPAPLLQGAPERGRAIPAGHLQGQLESADPDERKDALVEARSQRREGTMDWLNRNTARRAASAGVAQQK